MHQVKNNKFLNKNRTNELKSMIKKIMAKKIDTTYFSLFLSRICMTIFFLLKRYMYRGID